jgi:hypothetical protein
LATSTWKLIGWFPSTVWSALIATERSAEVCAIAAEAMKRTAKTIFYALATPL